ncbi:MAG: hypothetical protein AUK16_00475 [Parcubacteria group bacterium CG2_30_44_11]|nr:MAG: hypothetical protein AUK16_00475 [Parcubacteria group bacterium CG2_30_44_11]
MSSHYLIFDFDGVIGDTWEVTIAAYLKNGSKPSREAAILGMNQYFSTLPQHTRLHTLTSEQLADQHQRAENFGKIVHKIGFDLFNDFVHKIESLPTPYKAIVSSGSQKYVLLALAKTNINPTHILAFEDHHSKEDKIETICTDWGVTPNDVYYFTDSLADAYELQDFISPEKLIGVAWGFCGREVLLKELKPEYILDTSYDIHRVL